MSTVYRKPDQIVQPWWFGHKASKRTCLWLKGLPLLQPTNMVVPNDYVYKQGKKKGSRDPYWHVSTIRLPPKERSIVRSKTYKEVAVAMATQWTAPYTIYKQISLFEE
jgi:hypothetical protein